jgi:hypothetical protein
VPPVLPAVVKLPVIVPATFTFHLADSSARTRETRLAVTAAAAPKADSAIDVTRRDDDITHRALRTSQAVGLPGSSALRMDVDAAL